MSNEDLPIYTRGIFVKSAKYLMWSVRIDDKTYSSQVLKKLEKHLMNPNAKVGCWVNVRWEASEGLNKCKTGNRRVFIDLDTGGMYKSNTKVYEGENVWKCKKASSPIMKKIAKVVVDHMLEKWQKKFEKDQRVEDKSSRK